MNSSACFDDIIDFQPTGKKLPNLGPSIVPLRSMELPNFGWSWYRFEFFHQS